MPELRKDPILDRWVIISPERGKPIGDFLNLKEDNLNDFSPFTPNNESMTGSEIFAIRPPQTSPNTAGWSLRVIPNNQPALQIDEKLNRCGEGIYDMMDGVGAHEVVIETPDHKKPLSELNIIAITDVFRTYKTRILDLKKDQRLKYVIVFKNFGVDSGASITHSHSQLLATPVIPKQISDEINGSKTYYQLKERCIFCDMIHQELKDNVRVVYEDDQFMAMVPYAARWPFEICILPKEHASHYEEIKEKQLSFLSIVIKTILNKLNIALQTPPYNFVIHSAPIQDKASEYYHWHIELAPKLTEAAGFEWGTEFYINPTKPEEAAQYLKEVEIQNSKEI